MTDRRTPQSCCLTILAVVLGSIAASHAQAPPSSAIGSAVDWSGFYVGVNAGQASAKYDGIYDSSDIDEVPADSHIEATKLDDGGFAGGLHGGWNHQRGSLVVGVEADIASTSISNSAFEPEDGSEKTTAETNSMVSLRARAGGAVRSVLYYATAGIAYVKGDYSVEDQGDGKGQVDFNQAGAVAGGGIEWAAWKKVSLRAEGLYYFLGDRVQTSNLTDDSDPDDFIELKNSYVVRVGVSLRF